MILGLVLRLMQCVVGLADGLRYVQQAYLLPLLRRASGQRASAGKRPQHLAVIVPHRDFVEPVLGHFRTSGLGQLTIVVPEGGECGLRGKTLNVHLCTRGVYPANMLRQLRKSHAPGPDPPSYDLVVSLETVFGLHGVDARCIGFAQLAHKPCPWPSLVAVQLDRALDEYANCKQNYGK